MGRVTTDLSLASAVRLQRLVKGCGGAGGGAVTTVEVVPDSIRGSTDGCVELLRLLPNAAPAPGPAPSATAAAAASDSLATANAAAAAAARRLPRHLVLNCASGFALSHAHQDLESDPDQHQHPAGLPPAVAAALMGLRWRRGGIDARSRGRSRRLPLDLVAAALATWPPGALQSVTLLPGADRDWRSEGDTDLTLCVGEQLQDQARRRLHRLHPGSLDVDGKARRLLRLLCGAAQLLGRSGSGTNGGGGGGAIDTAAAAAPCTSLAPAPATVFPVWLARPPSLQSGTAATAAAHTTTMCEAVAEVLPRLLRLLPCGWFLYVGRGSEQELAQCLEVAAAAAASSGDPRAHDSRLRYSGAVWMAVLPEHRRQGVCVEGVFAGRLECVGEGRCCSEGGAGAVPAPPAGPQQQQQQQPPQQQQLPHVQLPPGDLAAFAAADVVAAAAEDAAEVEGEVELAGEPAGVVGMELLPAGDLDWADGDGDGDLDLDAALNLDFPMMMAAAGGLDDNDVWGAAAADGDGDEVAVGGGSVDLMDVDDG